MTENPLLSACVVSDINGSLWYIMIIRSILQQKVIIMTQKKPIIYNLEKESQNYERRHKLCNESHNLLMESRHDEKMTCSIKAKFSSFYYYSCLAVMGFHSYF